MAFETRTTLAGSENVARPGLVAGGTVSGSETIEVSVILRRKGPMSHLLESVKNVLHIGHEQHAEQHGSDSADVALVEQFAHEYGLTVVEASAPKRRVKLAGTADEMAQAFGVNFVGYTLEGSDATFRGRTGSLSIPTELKDIVTAVLGLDQRPVAKPHFRPAQLGATQNTTNQATTGSFTPQQVAALYSFPVNLTGKGQTIAIIELGGGYKTADLKTYFTAMKLAVPSVTAVSVDGGKNAPGGDADGEVLLDIEVTGAIANGAKIAVYFAPNTDQGFVDAITNAVHDSTRKPSVVSISWGGPEDSWSAQSRNAMNSALQDAATLGVTVTVASGDNGSTDGVGDKKLHVDFPASSPYALACGGTTLRGSGTTISSETVWNETAAQEGATGGGVSTAFALPAYQKAAGVPKQPQTGFVGRGVPDVAGDADPVTGYQVRVDGQNTVVGGTSAVAPLWAALIALLNQQLGKPVGFLNPKLYALSAASGAFHDITSGNNDDSGLGNYKSGKGWDACTGLGTPNGVALLKALSTVSTTTTTGPTPTAAGTAGTAGSGRMTIAGSDPQHSSSAEWTAIKNPAAHQIAATILLRRAGQDIGEQLLAGSAPALPHGETSSAVAASPEAVQKVTAFAKEQGLQVTEANATTRTVKVQGNAEQMERAFGVKLELVKEGSGQEYLSHKDAIAMPEALGSLITAVLGLDQRPVAKHHEAGGYSV